MLAFPPGPANASTPTSTATVTGPSGDGSVGNPFVYEIDFDCAELVTNVDDRVSLIASPNTGDYYQLTVNHKNRTAANQNCGSAQFTGGATVTRESSFDGLTTKAGFDDVVRLSFQYTGIPIGFGMAEFPGTPGPPVTYALWYVGAAPATANAPSASQSAPDPTASTVAVVAEQVAAAGVAGSSSAVRVRGTEVLPSSTARWSAASQSRINPTQTIDGMSVVGGTTVTSDGLEVHVGSAFGALSDAGVVVPSGGTLGASVTGALAPGSVVEVWINTQPRLVAAVRVPDDGGTVAVAIPTGAPLDGGEAIDDGAHTLELRMYTEDGFEIVATGITIGQVVPTRIPAGEGPGPFDRVLPLLGAGLVVAMVAGRRMIATG